MLSAKDFLFAFRLAKYPDASSPLVPGRTGGATRRLSGRARDSILMTSAPCSASVWVTSAPGADPAEVQDAQAGQDAGHR